MPPTPTVAVIGAGAFGGWTALHLLRRGAARVTLIDAWGPGNARASSGGETRILRGAYGGDRVYVEWVARSLKLWQEAESRWRQRFYENTGLLWMCGENDAYVRDSLPYLEAAGLPVAEVSLHEAQDRFPQFDFTGVRTLFFEKEAGYLLARRACQAVADAVDAHRNGQILYAAAAPGPLRDGRMERLELSNDLELKADFYVFACGPWLGRLFPEVIGERFLRVTRQEIFYFAPPPGDPLFEDRACPAWVDFGERIFYGIPGNEHRGFKVADDTRGEPFDPTSGERLPTPARLEEAREVLARRFPAMAGAPLVESRVCQYENSPDGHILFDRHPHASNVWLLGGGSGHGFKLSPALGEYAAGIILKDGTPDPLFRLDRPGHGESFQTQFGH
jgi:glycine/D-amino acid oxidase-like deaminating enzyme